MHAGRIYYIPEISAWMNLDGKAWKLSTDNAPIFQLAVYLPYQIYNEGNDHLSDAALYVKWARESQKVRTINTTISLLRKSELVRLSVNAIGEGMFPVGFEHARQSFAATTHRISRLESKPRKGES